MNKNLDNMIERNEIYTTGQIAEICGVSSRTVVKWFDEGELRGYRIPGSKDRRYTHKNLIEFMKKRNMPKILIDEYYNQQSNKDEDIASENKIYTTTEVAKICGVSQRLVVKWIDKQELNAYIIGKTHRRIPHKNLIKFMKDNGIYEFLKDNFKLD